MVELDKPQMTIYSNMGQVLCILDKEGNRHTLKICNTYCLSTATVVALTRLSVRFALLLPVVLRARYELNL